MGIYPHLKGYNEVSNKKTIAMNKEYNNYHEVRHEWKEYKISKIKDIAATHNIDLTITIANHLSRGIFGEGFNRAILTDTFGTPGRTSDDKSKDTDKILELIEMYAMHPIDIAEYKKYGPPKTIFG